MQVLLKANAQLAAAVGAQFAGDSIEQAALQAVASAASLPNTAVTLAVLDELASCRHVHVQTDCSYLHAPAVEHSRNNHHVDGIWNNSGAVQQGRAALEQPDAEQSSAPAVSGMVRTSVAGQPEVQQDCNTVKNPSTQAAPTESLITMPDQPSRAMPRLAGHIVSGDSVPHQQSAVALTRTQIRLAEGSTVQKEHLQSGPRDRSRHTHERHVQKHVSAVGHTGRQVGVVNSAPVASTLGPPSGLGVKAGAPPNSRADPQARHQRSGDVAQTSADVAQRGGDVPVQHVKVGMTRRRSSSRKAAALPPSDTAARCDQTSKGHRSRNVHLDAPRHVHVANRELLAAKEDARLGMQQFMQQFQHEENMQNSEQLQGSSIWCLPMDKHLNINVDTNAYI